MGLRVLVAVAMVFTMATKCSHGAAIPAELVGCFIDNNEMEIVNNEEYQASDFSHSNTGFKMKHGAEDACQVTCNAKRKKYFALRRNGGGAAAKCFCGNSLPEDEVALNKCNYLCPVEENRCGGRPERNKRPPNSVFKVYSSLGCLESKFGAVERYSIGSENIAASCRDVCFRELMLPLFSLRKNQNEEVECFCLNTVEQSYADLENNKEACDETCDGGNACGNAEGLSSVYSVCPSGRFGQSDDTQETCTETCDCPSALCKPDTGQCAQCFQGWQGELCTEDVDECATGGRHNCSGAAQCENFAGGFRCYCPVGYTINSDSVSCTDIDECDMSDECEHGECQNDPGSYHCICDSGYQPTSNSKGCEDVDECRSSYGGCDHICQNTEGSYYCRCDTGYDLDADRQTCSDIDECQTSKGGCDDICHNTQGSYYCSCDDGYSLDANRHTCSDVNECDSDPCVEGICHNTVGSYLCSCPTGFVPVGQRCVDIDECQTSKGGCDHTCHNTEGSYHCSCDDGYNLNPDNHTCSDDDECEDMNGGCSHTCHNTQGSYYCSCDPGYSLDTDDHACSDINECDDDDGGCEQNCNNTEGSYECSCEDGYQLGESKTQCQDVNECLSESHGCNQTCHNDIGSYHCSCMADVYSLAGDEKGCIDRDECKEGLAQCSHWCMNTYGGFYCHCDHDDQLYLSDDEKTCKKNIRVGLIAAMVVTLVLLVVFVTILVYCLVNKKAMPCERHSGSTSKKPAAAGHVVHSLSVQLEINDGEFPNANINIINNIDNNITLDACAGTQRKAISSSRVLVRKPIVNKKGVDGPNVGAPQENQKPVENPQVNRTPKTKPRTEDIAVKGGQSQVKPSAMMVQKSEIEEHHYGNLDDIIPQGNKVKVTEFVAYVEAEGRTDEPFKKEFESIPVYSPKYKRDEGSRPELKPKNRFKNILPYDYNRVHLKLLEDQPFSHYINASYVQGYHASDKFIAALGPRPNTVDDFWRMIWEQRCPLVVMLTNTVEGTVVKCEQYWPDSGSRKYGDITVTMSSQQAQVEYIIRKLRVTGPGKQPQMVTHYHFTVWPDHGVPRYAAALLQFRRRVINSMVPNRQTLVHCSAGVGRTGTLIALDYLLKQANEKEEISVYQCVSNLRDQRTSMIQTWHQYVFLHQALAEYFTVAETAIATYSLHEVVKGMEINRGRESTYYKHLQFLEKMSPIVDVYDTRDALTPENKAKNRDHSILPQTCKMPILKTEIAGRNNYINAVYVNSYLEKKGYIATQIPLENTIGDFWRMMYDCRCCGLLIIQTHTQSQEAPQFLPEQNRPKKVGKITVSLTATNRENPAGLTVTEVTIRGPNDCEEVNVSSNKDTDYMNTVDIIPGQLVTKVITMTVPDELTLLKAEHTIHVYDQTKQLAKQGITGPVVISCMDGCTFCGQYIAACNVFEMINQEKEVDVFQTVRQIKDSRPQFINSVEQYEQIYRLAKECVGDFDLYANYTK